MSQEIVLSDSGSELEIVLENIVTRPRPLSRGKILSWEEEEDEEEHIESEEVSGGFPSRGFDRRRYLKQLSTNTKDLDSIEPRVNTHTRSGLAGSPLNNNLRTAEPPALTSARGGRYWKYLQDVRCPFSDCSQTLELGALPSHVGGSPHWLPTHIYQGTPLTFSRTLLTSPGIPQLTTCDPVRFTFAGENFYLQTIASHDRRLLYLFVQVEGGQEDSERFWVKISVNSLDRSVQKGHATMTMRPTILNHLSSSDLRNALVMTDRTIVNICQWNAKRKKHVFQVEVKMMEDVADGLKR